MARYLCFVLSVFVAASSAFPAEVQTATLEGRVVTAAGQAIAGVAIELVAGEGSAGRDTVSGPDGAFRFELVPAGEHTLVLEHRLYRGLRLGVTVSAEGDPQVELVLVPVVSEVIEVQAAAPPAGRTATKVDAPILEIPQSIHVIPHAIVEEQGALRVIEVVTNVSGVVQGPGYGRTSDTFVVRGFAAGGIYKNGTPARVLTGIEDIANVERLEVLKGPAGALYGQGAPGGFVNVVTKRPVSTRGYSLMLRAGAWDHVDASADATGPIGASEHFTYRVVASHERSGSFRDLLEADRTFLAPSISWTPSAQTQLTVFGERIDQQGAYDLGFPVFQGAVIELPASRNLGEGWEQIAYDVEVLGYFFDQVISPSWLLRSTFRHQRTEEEDILITLASIVDERTVVRRVGELSQPGRFSDLTIDALGTFELGGLEHQLLVGSDLRRGESPFFFRSAVLGPFDIYDTANGASRPELSAAPFGFPAETETIGLYVQDKLRLGERIHVLAGARWDEVDNRVSDLRSRAVSPRLGVVFQARPSVSLYASYSSSFVPNSGVSFAGEPFDPQEADQLEVGIKQELAQGRVTATIAAYDLTRSNIPTADLDHPGFSLLVGEQRARGLELDILGRPSPSLSVVLAWAWTEAEVTRDNRLALGNALPGFPEHAGRAWINYEWLAGALDGFGVGLGLLYQGDRWGDANNTWRLGSFSRVDAAVSYRGQGWRAALNVKNLLDESYLESPITNTALPGAPRHLLGTVSFHF